MGDVVSQLVGEDVNTLLTPELCKLTYEEFLVLLGELNILLVLQQVGNNIFVTVKLL